MCGVAGIFGQVAERDARVARMVGQLRHRGPDGHGSWSDPEVTLGHSRLSIFDLTASGAQPMRRGTNVISFNGAIYNWRLLRRQLEQEGQQFQSECDTEVLLAMYEKHGIGMLPHLEGMFSFALWDISARTLHLVRDRYGVKPLYYLAANQTCVFASELRCFAESPHRGGLDIQALTCYLSTNYVPAPSTIWQGVRRLPPGCRLEIRPAEPIGAPIRWFSPIEAVDGREPRSHVDAVEALRGTLADSVAMRLQADVPVGVFLSGGVDSSIIAALACRNNANITTLTVGYADAPELDERLEARNLARQLGTDHREILITTADAQSAIIEVLDRLDEPFADDSLLPCYVLSKVARAEVAVALSGDGGDELFGGYQKYLGMRWASIPGAALIARALNACLSAIRDGRTHFVPNLVRMLRRFAQGAQGDLLSRHFRWVCLLDRDVVNSLRPHAAEEHPVLQQLRSELKRTQHWADELLRVLMADICYVLPFDMLEKVDRASMWNSLEVRSPFLDSRLLPLAFSFSGKNHVGYRRTKRVLRETFGRDLPQGTLTRKKKGFGIPLGEWMRGPLRPLLLERLEPRVVRQSGILNPVAVQNLLNEHHSRHRDRSWELWNAMVLQTWLSREMGTAALA